MNDVLKNWKCGVTSGKIDKRLIVTEDNQTICYVGHGNQKIAELISDYLIKISRNDDGN